MMHFKTIVITVLLIVSIFAAFLYISEPVVSTLVILDKRTDLEAPVNWQAVHLPLHAALSSPLLLNNGSTVDFSRGFNADYVLILETSGSPSFSQFYRLIDVRRNRLMRAEIAQSAYQPNQFAELIHCELPRTRLQSIVSSLMSRFVSRLDGAESQQKDLLDYAMELFKENRYSEAQVYGETAILMGNDLVEAAALTSTSAMLIPWEHSRGYIFGNVKSTHKPSAESLLWASKAIEIYLSFDKKIKPRSRKEFLKWHATGCLIIIAASDLLSAYYHSTYPDEMGIMSSGPLSNEEQIQLAELRKTVRKMCLRLMESYDRSEHRWIPVGYSPYFKPTRSGIGEVEPYNIYEVIGLHGGSWYDLPEQMTEMLQRWLNGLAVALPDQRNSILLNTLINRSYHYKWFISWRPEDEPAFSKAWENYLTHLGRTDSSDAYGGLDVRLLAHAMNLSNETKKIFVNDRISSGSNRNLLRYYEAIWESKNRYLWGELSASQLGIHYNHIQNLLQKVDYEREDMVLRFNRLKHDLMIEAIENGSEHAEGLFRISANKDSINAYGSEKVRFLRQKVYKMKQDWSRHL